MEEIPWILSESDKAHDIRDYMVKDVLKWKHGCSLKGAMKYDFFLGCYGNPDRSDHVLLAEIPSLYPLEIVAEAHDRETAWKSAWKATEQDLVFRIALERNGLIPSALSDSPWDWNCWITDFVKCAEYAGDWGKKRKKTILRDSSRLLKKELRRLRPKRVIFMGDNPSRFFMRYCSGLDKELGFTTATAPHYSFRPKDTNMKEEFFHKFEIAISR
jgi:hypothetical protein